MKMRETIPNISVTLGICVVRGSLNFFSRQGFSVALVPVLVLALVYQAGLELTEIFLPLPPKCWD